MADLIEILGSFNRKERFFLLAQALEGGHSQESFVLSEAFRNTIREQLNVEIPSVDSSQIFVGMDYHINWIYASLVMAFEEGTARKQSQLNKLLPDDRDGKGIIQKNQEDVDLLIAFRADKGYRLLIIEAKGYDAEGCAAFDSNQLKTKIERLSQAFRDYPEVTAIYCLASGYRPQNLQKWPKWNGQELKWFKLELPCDRHVVGYKPEIYRLTKHAGSGCKKFAKKQLVP